MTQRRATGRSAASAEYRRLYSTARWKRLRVAKLSEQPLCEWCLERDIVTEATEVHHADEAKFWAGPFVSTCKPCHSSRGQREDLGQTVVTFGLDGYPL